MQEEDHREAVSLKQTQLSVQIGDRLQLQKTSSDRPERYLVQVVGLMAGQSVIITTPRVNGKVAIIRQGQGFTVRVLRGSSIFGFVSSVLQVYSAPFPHLHLAYPREMESIVVRDSLRAATDVQVVVRNNKHPDSREHYRMSQFVDLSNSGARLVSKGPLGQEDEMLSMQFSIEVCGMQENMGMLGKIRGMGKRNVQGDALQFWTGIQFQALNRFQKVLLQAYALEKCLGGK